MPIGFVKLILMASTIYIQQIDTFNHSASRICETIFKHTINLLH